MKHQLTPNAWSCVPTAVAIFLGKPVEWVIKQMGHDGSEEPFEDDRHKIAFHHQEFIDILWTYGYSCTPIERFPATMPKADGSVKSVPLKLVNWEEKDARLAHYLLHNDGILTGTVTSTGAGHAATWDHEQNTLHDPKNRSYKNEEIKRCDFQPQIFWIITSR